MKNKKSDFLIEAIVLAVAAVITLPLRTVQYAKNIEAYRGFYTEMNAGIYIFYAIIAAAFIYFLVDGIAKHKKIVLDTSASKKPGNAIICLLCAFGAVESSLVDYLHRGDNTAKYAVTSTMTDGVASGFTILQIAFAALTAVYFILLAIAFLSGKTPSSIKLSSLAPVIWCLLRLVVRFTRTVSYIRVSDLLLEMLMLVMYCLFFMAFAQTNSRVGEDHNEWKLISFGLTGALLGFICFIPRAVATVTGHSDAIYILSTVDFSDFAFALFITATVTTRLMPRTADVLDNGNTIETVLH